jgi:hypothetical protein
MARCAHCGKEADRVADGLCQECLKNCNDAMKLSDYKSAIIAFLYAALEALFGAANKIPFPEAVFTVCGTIVSSYMLCALADLLVKPLYAKSKRYRIIASIIVVAVLSAGLYYRGLKAEPQVSHDEYQQLLDEYNELDKKSARVSSEYDDLLQDLDNLSDDIEGELYYGYSEIADELDDIVSSHE